MNKVFSWIEKNFGNKAKIQEKIIVTFLMLCSAITILITIGIITVLAIDSFKFFQTVSIISFFTDSEWTPLFYEKHYGIWPLLSGTFISSLIAICIAIPIGLTIAVYLSEYAPSKTTLYLKPILEILAAIPTVVYGFFALLFVTPLLQNFIPNLSTYNALSAGLVMGIMIIPYVCSLSEDAMRAVPNSLREAAYGLGSTKFQTSFKIVIPSAASGISVAFILAISRAIGETMIVAIAAGQEPRLSLNPANSIETITTYIIQVSMGDISQNSIEYKTIFAAGMTLFIFTFILNNISYWIKRKYINKYAQQ